MTAPPNRRETGQHDSSTTQLTLTASPTHTGEKQAQMKAPLTRKGKRHDNTTAPPAHTRVETGQYNTSTRSHREKTGHHESSTKEEKQANMTTSPVHGWDRQVNRSHRGETTQ